MLLPAQPPLMFVAGPARGLIAEGGAFGAGVEFRAAGPPGAVVQACVAETVKNVSATATDSQPKATSERLRRTITHVRPEPPRRLRQT